MTQPSKSLLQEAIDQAVEWEHSPVGPSAATRWMHCPGSVLATIDLEDVSSSFAIEGTAGHTVTEWCRERGHHADEYLGVMVPVWVNEKRTDLIECNQEMVDAVNVFLDYVDQFDGDIYVEEKVSYEQWVIGGFGTSDDMRVTNKRCVVTDFKYGKGIQVYAEDNAQLKFYALGFYHDFGYLYDIDEFQLNICQPRLEHIDEWTISLEDLLTWAEEEAGPAGRAALTPGASFAAGSWCQFCLLNTKDRQCKVRAKHVFDAVIGDFDDLDGNDPVEKVDVNILTHEELGLMLPWLTVLNNFVTDIKEHALSVLGKGETIPHPVTGDYKLVAGRGGRKWLKDAEETKKELRGTYKLRVKDFTNTVLMTPPQVEKVVGKKSPIMTEMVEKTPGKPTLAAGTDKRPALAFNPEEEFEDETLDEQKD